MITPNWFGWVLIGMYALSILVNVGTIGEYRKPLTPGSAVFIVILNTLLILGILFVGTQ